MTRSKLNPFAGQSLPFFSGSSNQKNTKKSLSAFHSNALSENAQKCLKGGDGEEEIIIEEITGD